MFHLSTNSFENELVSASRDVAFDCPSPHPLFWLQYSRSFFQHEIRDALRSTNLAAANKRLDLKGIAATPVDRFTLDKTLRKFNDYQKGIFSAILAGGLCSAKQFCKAGLVHDPMCPFCGLAEEDVEHIFLKCPAWTPIRLKFPSVSLTRLGNSDPCTKICAVPMLPVSINNIAHVAPSHDVLEIATPLTLQDPDLETKTGDYVVLSTDGSCKDQQNSFLRRAGYGVAYDKSLSHSRTLCSALKGPQQTAQRAEVRAVLAALCIETRPLQIRSDSKYVVDFFTLLLQGFPLPVDGEHIDLWRQIQSLILIRTHPISIVWVQGHVTQEQVDKGLFFHNLTRTAMMPPTELQSKVLQAMLVQLLLLILFKKIPNT